MQDKAKLIEILKKLDIYPKTGFGEVILKLNDGNIVQVEIKESKKI